MFDNTRLKHCAGMPFIIISNLFNTPLKLALVPTFLKLTAVFLVLKHTLRITLNSYCLVALILVVRMPVKKSVFTSIC